MGQEPCAVGVAAHLTDADVLTAPHRVHHLAVAKGVDLKAMAAEIFGKPAGLSGGRGGHMHLLDRRTSFYSSGIVGQGLPPAVGAALGLRMQGRDAIAVAFVGEGATNQGVFHEALNLAGLWRLPFICVVEDNAWAVSVPKSSSTAVSLNVERAAAYGIAAEHVADNDPQAIFDAAGRAVTRARSGGGATLLEIETVRLAGHFVGDTQGYIPPAERAALKQRDPIPRWRARLVADGVLSDSAADEVVAKAKAEVDAAMRFARACEDAPGNAALQCVFA
jgi:pyruvate dehydrogenase E1 component alpha subunit